MLSDFADRASADGRQHQDRWASFAMTSVNDRSRRYESVDVGRITMVAPALTDKRVSLATSSRRLCDVRRNIHSRHVSVNDLIRISPDDTGDSYGRCTDTDLTDSRACFYPKTLRPDRLRPIRSLRRFPRTDDQTVDEYSTRIRSPVFPAAHCGNLRSYQLPAPISDMNLIVADAADVPSESISTQRSRAAVGTDGEVSDVSFIIAGSGHA